MTYQVSKLDFIIQQVLPTVYDDSLSFYELVNKVVIKVNELIDQSNLYFGQEIETVIGNILTDWEASGKLSEVINEAIVTGKVNVSDFNAFKTSNTQQLDDYAKMIIDRNYRVSGTPEEYGAKGDGVTDDTEAIQRCLDQNTISVFTSTDYRITKMLTLPAYHSIQGNGARIIVQGGWTPHTLGGTLNANTILWVQSRYPVFNSELKMKSKHIKDLRIYGDSAYTHVGLYFGTLDKQGITDPTSVNNAVADFFVENVSVDNVNVGFWLSEVWGTSFVSCRTGQCRYVGLLYRGQCVNNFFSNCTFTTGGVGNSAIFIDGDTYQGEMRRPEGQMFSNCFIGVSAYGVNLVRGLAINFTGCVIDLNQSGMNMTDASCINVTDCWIQADTFPCVTLQDMSTTENNTQVSFKGCNFNPTGAGNISLDVGKRQNGISVSSCFFGRRIEFHDASVGTVSNSFCTDPETSDYKIIKYTLSNVLVDGVRFKTTGNNVPVQQL